MPAHARRVAWRAGYVPCGGRARGGRGLLPASNRMAAGGRGRARVAGPRAQCARGLVQGWPGRPRSRPRRPAGAGLSPGGGLGRTTVGPSLWQQWRLYIAVRSAIQRVARGWRGPWPRAGARAPLPPPHRAPGKIEPVFCGGSSPAAGFGGTARGARARATRGPHRERKDQGGGGRQGQGEKRDARGRSNLFKPRPAAHSGARGR